MVNSIKENKNTIKLISLFENFFLLQFVVILFLSPLGLPPTPILSTDISGLFTFAILSFLAILGFRFRPDQIKLTFPLIILLIFVFLECFLPLIGIFIWNDITVITSSMRAFLYWIPLLITLAILLSRKKLEDIASYNKIIYIALIANFLVASIELAVYFGNLPEFFNIRNYLEPLTSPNLRERFAYNRIWSAGFFSNSHGLGAFASMLIGHFLARNVLSKKSIISTIFPIIALLAITVMSTSRTALLSSLIMIMLFLLLVGNHLIIKNRFFFSNLFYIKAITLSIITTGIIWLMSYSSELFKRYQRLSGGLEADYSASVRTDYLWPRALNFYRELGHPTFTNPTEFVGTIDSGFLTYLLQGGPIFIGIACLLPLSMFISGFYVYFIKGKESYPTLLMMFSSIYIMIAIININPLRSIEVILFISISIISFSCERIK